MKIRSAVVILAALLCARAYSRELPGVPDKDRIRIAEAYRISDRLGDKIWKGWNDAPFAILLVTSEYEFLIRHARPPADFTALGVDPDLHGMVYVRPRTADPKSESTVLLGRGAKIPTIVIGQPEQTGAKSSTSWILALFHEHFHQLQMSQPEYEYRFEALDLPAGNAGETVSEDAFPYDAPAVRTRYDALGSELSAMIEPADNSVRSEALDRYFLDRQSFRDRLDPLPYRYFSFELWREGVARYIEYRAASLAAGLYTPSEEFRNLENATNFAAAADSVRSGILEVLRSGHLEESRRSAFYAVGAAEAILLDRVNPEWQRSYFGDEFNLRLLFSPQ